MEVNRLAKGKIGVLDSGVGGLTVVKQLEKLLPGEDIVYYGDSANCPYGTREKEDILVLMNRILDFMEEKNVKAIAVACNTLSTLYDAYAPARRTPIFSIVAAGADYVASQKLERVGVVGTDFTIRSGWYGKLIQEKLPGAFVTGSANHELATLVDRGEFEKIPANIRENLAELKKQGEISHVILGCTHYPIVRDIFEAQAPGLTFIDPALEQARAVKAYLAEKDLLNPKENHTLEIYTSKDPEAYAAICKKIGIETSPMLVLQPLG